MTALFIACLVVLAGVGVHFLLQLLIILGASLHNDKELFKLIFEEDENGMISRRKEPFRVHIIAPAIDLMSAIQTKKVIKFLAKSQAEESNYDNRFKKEKHQNLYDDVYLKTRQKVVSEQATKDAKKKHPSNPFTIPMEAALYQEEYLKKVTGINDSKNLVKNRLDRLYKTDNSEPVPSDVFVEIVKQERH